MVTKADVQAVLASATVADGAPTTNASETCGYEVSQIQVPGGPPGSATVEIDRFATATGAPPYPDSVAEIPGGQYDSHLGLLRVPLANGATVEYRMQELALRAPDFTKSTLVTLATATSGRFTTAS